MKTSFKTYLAASAMTGLALGLSDALMANYFKEAYDVNAAMRGFIEFPRELPGVLATLYLAGLSFLGDRRAAVFAQLLSAAACVALGLITPSFGVMLLFLFMFTSGTHLFMPLSDSIGMSLAGDDKGAALGRINGIRMVFTALAGIVTFAGFKTGFFTFGNPIAVFLLAAACFVAAAVLLGKLPETGGGAKRPKLLLRREYLRYYVICALFGGRKQIMIVYSPWVLIDLLNFRADSISILSIFGAIIGIFFMPRVGKWIDRFGVKKIMTAEALAFIGIYLAYGVLSKSVADNMLTVSGIVLILAYALNVVDRAAAQFGMVRSLYMRKIALREEDVTPSLSMGMSIDHVVAIIGSYVCGVIWFNLGPEWVFAVSGALSLGNLLVARGIRGIE